MGFQLKIMPTQFEWQRGFNRNLILSKIDKIRKIDGQRCWFDTHDYEFWLPVLSSAIRLNRNAELLNAKCISAALSDASINLNNPDAFLVRCDQEFEKLSRRTRSRFVLYTTITYSGPKLIDWIADDNARIYWQPSLD